MWNVRDSPLHLRQVDVAGFHLLLETANIFFQLLHLGERLRVRLPAHGRQFVAAPPLFFEPCDAVPTLAVELDEALETGAAKALRKLPKEVLGALSQAVAC